MLRKKYIAQKLLGDNSIIYKIIKNTYTGNRLIWYSMDVYAKIFKFNIKSLNRLPLWNGIEIETINKCNGRCTFCPANIDKDIRVRELMSRQTYEKIIGELSVMDYNGTIAFHSNNEPLLDDRIYDFIDYARDKCRHATLFMYTNGVLLTESKLVRLIKSLDFLVIDWYVDDLNENCNNKIKSWKQAVKIEGISLRKLKIEIRKRNETLSSRGGISPNCKLKLKPNHVPCYEPYSTIVVRPSGQVSMCKCDAYGEVTLGDINLNTLKEIWESEEYSNLRKKVRKGRNTGMCKKCNFPVY